MGTRRYSQEIFRYTGALAALLALLGSYSHGARFPHSAQTFPTLRNALEVIASRYRIHIGLEFVTNDSDATPINLDLSGDEVGPVLDRLIVQRPAYIWNIQDGVCDVYPRAARDGLLDVNIRAFSVKDATPEEASRAISELSEVKNWLSRYGVRRRELETGPRWKNSDRRVSLTLTNVPLRSVLNNLVKEAQEIDWIVIRYGEKAEYIGIYI